MAKSEEFKFKETDWQTPNTFDRNYKDPPELGGVYLLVLLKLNKKSVGYKILYVGSSKNLKQRYARHEVRRILTEMYGYVRFYFKVFDNYLEEEKRLIGIIQPKFNKQYNGSKKSTIPPFIRG